jgi:3-keto-disaccharide hydrolase
MSSRDLLASILAPVLAFTAFGLGTVGAAEPGDIPEDALPLFDGRDLNGWYGLGHFNPSELAAMSPAQRQAKRAQDMEDFRKHWTAEHGELINDGHGPYATNDQEYGDVEFWIDYKTVPLADSGIYLRGTPQVQIWDWTEAGGKWEIGADKGSGGLWNNSPGAPGKDPLVLADRPFGQWNQFHVIQLGARTTVTLNGKRVVEHATMENFWDRGKPLPRRGPIQLQTHGGEIRWRNIHVRKIPADQANAMLASHNADGYKTIFNGKDLTGWQGATGNYQVRDGAIVCKPGQGGNLFTDTTYGDFAVRLEFKLPPAGNNGLAIRCPGPGDPSVNAMCELQVLDSEHPKYAKLDDRQYHGSAYGMVPAVRGYLRPTGEWNFQEVTVVGSTIQVELNGSKILDADLSQVTETMGGKSHPGKDRTSGHFGFAGHGDPVAFRNISIKRLE